MLLVSAAAAAAAATAAIDDTADTAAAGFWTAGFYVVANLNVCLHIIHTIICQKTQCCFTFQNAINTQSILYCNMCMMDLRFARP